MGQYTLNKQALDEVKGEVTQLLLDYAEDIRTTAENNCEEKDERGFAINDTGAMARGYKVSPARVNDRFAEVTVFNDVEYSKYIEFGTQPFNPKLIEINLPTNIQRKIGKKLVVKDGKILAPVFIDWVRLKLGIRNKVEQYNVAWAIYRKIQRDGIRARYPFTHAVAEMSKHQKYKNHFQTSGVEVRQS